MQNRSRDHVILGVFWLGVSLILFGWCIDFFSSGDPHLVDTVGWIVVCISIVSYATRWGNWFETLQIWATPQHLLSGALFVAVSGFTGFYWYVTSALVMKSQEPGLSEGAAGILHSVVKANHTFFLPMLFIIAGLAFVSLLMTFTRNCNAAISSNALHRAAKP